MRTTLPSKMLLLSVCVCCAEGQTLKVELEADKSEYVELEPIRLTARLINPAEQDFVLQQPPGAPAGTLIYYRLLPDGTWASVGEFSLVTRYERCVPSEALPPTIGWRLAAKGSRAFPIWLSYDTTQHFGTGTTRFCAKFKPLSGPMKDVEIASEIAAATIRKPTGRDLAAYRFLMRPSFEGSRQNGLIMNSGSHHSRDAHNTIITNTTGSVYADYFRYTQTTYLNYHEADRERYETRLREIVDGARADFPLLGNAYFMLLYHYQQRRELEKMAALSQQFLRLNLRVADPDLSRQITHLVGTINWWPPKTAEDRARAAEAALIVRARALADAHWIVRDLTAGYGASRQPKDDANYAERSFYDPQASWSSVVKFWFGTNSEPVKVILHGSLGTFCTGELDRRLARIKRAYSLDNGQAKKVFIEATVEAEQMRGRLQFPDGFEKPFSMAFSLNGKP